MAAGHTIDAIWARNAVARLQEAKQPIADILSAIGIDPLVLKQRGSRIAFRQHATLLDRAAELTGDDCFALNLAARPMDLREVGLLTYVGLSSKTLGEAIRNLARFVAILNEAVRVELQLEGDRAIVALDVIDATVRTRQQAMEFAVANLVRALRAGGRRDLRLVEVAFLHPRSREIDAFERFFGCPVHFRQPRYTVSLARSQLNIPIVTADPRLLAILTSYCKEVLADRGRASLGLRHEVERVLMNVMPKGEADTQTVARELGLSVRTLSRKLKDDGVNFLVILDELRADLAKQYLGDKSRSLAEVAYLLGYSDASAFSHAFRRWTGKTPGQVR